jgi:hypothetical protein
VDFLPDERIKLIREADRFLTVQLLCRLRKEAIDLARSDPPVVLLDRQLTVVRASDSRRSSGPS